MALPRFILSNPFRILGIPANSSERQIVASAARLKAYARVGKVASLPLDFPGLFGNTFRTVPLIDSCGRLSHTTSLRMKYAMVWFSVSSGNDSYALDLLRIGDTASALEILGNHNTSFSSHINSAVIDFSCGIIGNGVVKVLRVLETEPLRSQFISAITPDGGFSERDLVLLFTELLSESFTYDDISLWYSGHPLASDILNEMFQRKWRAEIDSLIANINNTRSNDAEHVAASFNRLKYLLEWVSQTMPNNDPACELIHDAVARSILEKVISFSNAGVSGTESRTLMRLLREASAIAFDTSLKARCMENYSLLKSIIT